jgi:integrase
MSDFMTIRRGQPTKGRSDESRRVRTPENQRVLAFATKVGIRKMEYSHLKGSDFVQKGGRAYVVVRKGKGGKRQEQLILPEDVEFVRSYFDGSENYVFSKEEIKACTHANLHEIRRERAQKLYERWRVELKDPAKREEMMRLLEERFNENPKKMGKFSRSKMDTPYRTRGEVRKELYEANKPLEYDRLALLSVSVLALAHYREDVCVKHYMK